MTPNKLYLLFLAHGFFGGHDDRVPPTLAGTWQSASGAVLVFDATNETIRAVVP